MGAAGREAMLARGGAWQDVGQGRDDAHKDRAGEKQARPRR